MLSLVANVKVIVQSQNLKTHTVCKKNNTNLIDTKEKEKTGL
jgi:hypothetical protein